MTTARTVLEGLDGVKAAAGRHLGYSDWVEITDERVEVFERAVGLDVPLDYLVLSLSNFLLPQIVEVRGVSMGVNYGADSVRFPASVGAGARLRAGAELVAVDDVSGGVQTTMRITIDVEGRTEPACVIESLSRFMV